MLHARYLANLFLGLLGALAQVGASPVAEPEELHASTPRIENPKICDPSVKQYSGYFGTGVSGIEYFFWLFESRGSPKTDPLVLWLSGGPGVSSVLALLSEVGPCAVKKDGATTARNPYSLNTRANVMWVDQPAGVGFSSGLPTEHSELQVGDNMYGFLQALLASQELSKFAKNPFFVFGDSYAGHFVPAVAHRIFQGNKNKEGIAINLQGLAIGNGWVNPSEQFKWFADMAKDGGRSEGGSLAHGVISNPVTIATMKAAVVPCTAAIDQCNAGFIPQCATAYTFCNNAQFDPFSATHTDLFDMRHDCLVDGSLCLDPSIAPVTKFLNSEVVQQQLGVSKPWVAINPFVPGALYRDYVQRYDTLLPDMLADGVRVLVYAGDTDYACNWIGTKKWMLALEWQHHLEFNSAADRPYTLRGKSAASGRLRSANGLSFLQVYQAGHLVPRYQPEVALDMFDGFLTKTLDERVRSSELVV